MAEQAHERRIHELDQNVERYFDVRKRLGKGAYGIVWKATDKRQKDTVALKKIYDAFRDDTDAQRTYREVIFLRAFRHHPNIVRILDIFKASNNLDFYLVFEFMESDLHNVIKKGDVLKDIHKRFVMYQLINAIKYMHSGNVIHRDLKPSNILIDSKCRLKVADFGLARTLCPKRRNNLDYDCKDELDNEAMLTDYVATRWYRAPEILVASRRYTKGVDMWSLGCILGEMIRQKPLFQGTSTINQIEKIINALPDVTDRDIESIGASFGSVLLSKKIVRDRRNSLDEMLRNCCDDAMGLVKSLLVLDPEGRLTAKEAISHPYVSRFRASSATMDMHSDVKPPLDDDVRYGVEEYRGTLYRMITPERAAGGSNTTRQSQRQLQSSSSSETHLPPDSTLRNSKSVSKTRLHSTHFQAFGDKDTPKEAHNKTWSEQYQLQKKKQQQQQQQQQQLQQQQEQLQLQQQQQQQHQRERGKRYAHEQQQQQQQQQQRQHAASGNLETTKVAMRRELAAVAATAPRCNTGGLWQAPVETQPQSRLWKDTLGRNAALSAKPSQVEMESKSRTRLRKPRKDKEKSQPKQQQQQQEQRLAQGQTQATIQAKAQERALALKQHLLQQQKQHEQELSQMDLALTLQQLQLEHQQLNQQKKQTQLQHQTATATATATATRPTAATKTTKPSKIPTAHHSSDFVCYKSRLSHLELEMSKCKRQLFSYVQDNQQLLHKESLRHHIEQLLETTLPVATATSATSIAATVANTNIAAAAATAVAGAGAGAGTQPQREQLKQLQMREFLARDECNANAYELPDLCNVYKASRRAESQQQLQLHAARNETQQPQQQSPYSSDGLHIQEASFSKDFEQT
ncbi:extracellular signal-regulated kinase 7 isoform X2 [Drosophila busckii]|uniref:extracellular signal-regulated kinase 7 isoform X2 n=1 Tax=Drosophila busckii TaxID=30019 RepID=UPI00083F38A3|nr:extracellular signal-regulated kinase 7 isoform X2 [Drosophila busckii]